jgi:hypothetical protein
VVSKRLVACVIAATVIASLAMAAPHVTASGSEVGDFPNRIFHVLKAGNDNTYSAELVPSWDGEWWVELISLQRGTVAVLIKNDCIVGGHQKESSTDLSCVGAASKHTFVGGGCPYTVTFTLKSGHGEAVLKERFIPYVPEPAELPPFGTTTHAPISLAYDQGFDTPGSGVTAGTGTADDPYIIEGWEISVVTDHIGIELWYTSSYVAIRHCFVHAIGFPAGHGIQLFGCSNVVIEECWMMDCLGTELIIGSSNAITVRDCAIWNSVYIYDSDDCTMIHNVIREPQTNFQYNNRLTLLENTFSGADWLAIWLVSNQDALVAHNNLVDNAVNVWVYMENTITWVLDGRGNYWSDYTGVDTNGDGVGDSPYIIDAYNRDDHPLMAPFVPGSGGTVAEAGPIQYVTVPLPAMITLDGSGSYAPSGIVSYVWTWVGGVDNTPKTVTGVNPSVPWQWFYYIDNYTVTLTVTDAQGNIATDTTNVYFSPRLVREDNAFYCQQWYAESDGYLKVMIDNHGMRQVNWSVMDVTSYPHVVYESTIWFSGDGIYVSEPFWMTAGQNIQIDYEMNAGPEGAYFFVYGFFVPVP